MLRDIYDETMTKMLQFRDGKHGAALAPVAPMLLAQLEEVVTGGGGPLRRPDFHDRRGCETTQTLGRKTPGDPEESRFDRIPAEC